MAVDAPRNAEPPPSDVKAVAQVYFLVLFVMLVCGVGFASLGRWSLLGLVAGSIVLLMLSAVYLVFPALVGRRVWLSSHPEIRAIDLETETLPEAIEAKSRSTFETLQSLGFAGRVVYFVSQNDSQNASYLAIFDNRAERTLARWLVLLSNPRAPDPILTFTTRFADGTEFITGNSTNPSVTSPPKFRKGFTFPGVEDPARLHWLHHRGLSELGEFSMRVNQIEGDPLAFLRNSLAEEMGHLVKSGYYRLEKSSGRYRMTLMGTYLGTWKQVWPWGPIRKSRLQLRAARRIREWEASA